VLEGAQRVARLLQHELEPLVRKEAIVQRLDREGIGEPADANGALKAAAKPVGG